MITLADKPLANSVSGTIQNLGVEGSGTLTLEDGQGSMANTVTQTGTVQNCYCTVNSQVAPMSYDTIGGMIGNLNGTIRNCYFAAVRISTVVVWLHIMVAHTESAMFSGHLECLPLEWEATIILQMTARK